LVGLIVVPTVLSGCAGVGAQAPGGRQLLADLPGAFAPASIRVHPLTQLSRDQSGEPQIILHAEMLDAWGDTVKGAGRLSVRIVSVDDALDEARVGADELRWDVDLLDLERNAAHYDPSSRTYRVVLGGLPAWLGAMAPAPERSGGRARLLVSFETAAKDGRVQVLRDETELSG